MSTEQKDTEQNALAQKLNSTWTNFKQGKLISYKMMAVLLLLVAGLALWWYISTERRKATSKLWLDFDDANTAAKLEELAKRDEKAVTAKLSRLLVARAQLGPEGIDMLNNERATTEQKTKAVENIEKAREAFGKLLPQFEKDPVFKAECLLALAKAEAVLVGVPLKPDQPISIGPIAPTKDAKGKVDVVLKYLDELVAAAPDTPWATDAKQTADSIRKNPTDFETIQQSLTSLRGRSPLEGPMFPPKQ